MYRIALLLLLSLPSLAFSQGVLEKMQSDIAANTAATSANTVSIDKVKADLVLAQAALKAAQADIAASKADLATLKLRVEALEKLVTPPPPPPSSELNLTLQGGYRITGEFSRGAIAIDHANRKMWMVGHAQRNEVYEYDLPVMGTGSNVNTWPILPIKRIIQGWWPAGEGYANGLAFWNGKLWACPRVFYDMQPPPVTKMYATDGEVRTINIPRQKFAGFVKSAGGLELGGGGYESGQGSSSGPSLAKLDGTALIQYGWPSLPSDSPAAWNERCPREPNYWYIGHTDNWVAWEPRPNSSGVVEGRWASDRIYGGGIRHSTGIYFWPWMGTGELNYALQTSTFALDKDNRTYLYRYDPTTYKLSGWKLRDFTGPILGQEISPDGQTLYLTEGSQWASGLYKVDHILRVYGVAN